MANARELAPWRRRVARLCLVIAAIVGSLMLSALPMAAFALAGRREEHISLAVLLAVVMASIWAYVALGRRRRSGQRLAWGLGAYAMLMATSKVVAFAGL